LDLSVARQQRRLGLHQEVSHIEHDRLAHRFQEVLAEGTEIVAGYVVVLGEGVIWSTQPLNQSKLCYNVL
jgi:hypothetical protein